MLSDKKKRARYDQFGHAGVDPSYGGGAAGGSPFGADIDLETSSIPSSAASAEGGSQSQRAAPRRAT